MGEMDKDFFRQMKKGLVSQDLILTVGFNHPSICWWDNIAGHKQSKSFLEVFDNKFPTQVVKNLKRRHSIGPHTYKQGRTDGKHES